MGERPGYNPDASPQAEDLAKKLESDLNEFKSEIDGPRGRDSARQLLTAFEPGRFAEHPEDPEDYSRAEAEHLHRMLSAYVEEKKVEWAAKDELDAETKRSREKGEAAEVEPAMRAMIAELEKIGSPSDFLTKNPELAKELLAKMFGMQADDLKDRSAMLDCVEHVARLVFSDLPRGGGRHQMK